MGTQRYINGGVALVVAVVLAIVGSTAVTDSNYDNVLTLDSQSEWNNYEGTATDTVVTSGGAVELAGDNTSGSWTSSSISNATNRVSVYAEIPDSDNSTANITVDGTTYELQDGNNAFKLGSNLTGGYTFTLDFERDSTSISTPSVGTYTAQQGSSDGLMSILVSAAFGLLLLFAVLQVRGGRGPKP